MPNANITEVTFVNVPGTSLYTTRPETPVETMMFLRWNTAEPPPEIPISKTWEDSGPPAQAGCYLFLDAAPPPSTARAFEVKLRKELTESTATSFAWGLSASDPIVQTKLPVKLDADKPVLADNVIVQLPRGLRTVGFAVASPVTASHVNGRIENFVVHYAPMPGADPPAGAGIALWIQPGARGCLRFDGLVNGGASPAGKTLKTLVRVQFDPVHPFDLERNYQEYTGMNYYLEQIGAQFQLTVAS
jgi:hypothetical protein